MKMLSALLLAIFVGNIANAVSYKIIGAEGETISKGTVDITGSESVGSFTFDLMSQLASAAKVHWTGDVNSVLSINNLGQTDAVASPGNVKAYGWCFKLNRSTPNVGMDEIMLTDGDKLVWYYGYIREVSGQWQKKCIQANK